MKRRLFASIGPFVVPVAALVGFACFVLAMIFVRTRGRGTAAEERYRPTVVRVLESNSPRSIDLGNSKAKLISAAAQDQLPAMRQSHLHGIRRTPG